MILAFWFFVIDFFIFMWIDALAKQPYYSLCRKRSKLYSVLFSLVLNYSSVIWKE